MYTVAIDSETVRNSALKRCMVYRAVKYARLKGELGMEFIYRESHNPRRVLGLRQPLSM